MPTLTDRLRSLFGSRAGADPQTTGLLKLGSSTFQAQTYTLPRVAASVYNNPTGYRAVEYLANNLSRPAWETYKAGTTDPVESSLLNTLNNPAKGYSGTQMQAMMGRDLTLTGRSAHLKMQGVDGWGDKGPVTGLRRLSPYRLVVLGNQDDELVGFIYSDRKGVRVPILKDDVVYLHYPNPERYFDGIAPAVVAGLPAEIDSSAMRFNYDLLANDGAIPGYISVKGLLPDQFAAWVAAWQAKEVPGKMRFLGGSGDVSFVRVGLTNQELAYDKLRDYSQKDISLAIGVPYVILNPTDTTFANMSEARSVVWQGTILPTITLENDELTHQLGEPEGLVVGQRLDEIDELSEAADAVIARGVLMLDRSVITINEFRVTDLGLDPVAWGDLPMAPMAPMKAEAQTPGGAAPQPTFGQRALKLLPAPIKTKGKVDIPDFHRRVETFEKRMERAMIRFFKRQGKVVSARVRAGGGKSHAKALDTPAWWDKARWDLELADELDATYSDTVDAFATDVVARLGAGFFDPNSPAVRDYIMGKVRADSVFINQTTADEVRALIVDGEAQGLGIADIADSINLYFSGTDAQAAYRAERVARTEVISASNYGALEGARASGVVASKQWLTAGGGECDDCAGLDGETVGIDEQFSSGDDAPGLHPNCLIAGTVVAGPSVHATFSRSYQGPLITIRATSGDELTGTPNHPVLTPKGWVALGALREGDDVFCCPDAQRMATAIDPQHHQIPALIEQVRAANSVALLKVPSAAAHFHGDGMADGHVHVELADGSLYAHGEPSRSPFLKQISDGNLRWAGMTASELLRQGSATQIYVGAGHASHGSVSGLTEGRALSSSAASHTGVGASTAVARFDPGVEQTAAEDVTADAGLVAERLLRLAVGVTPQQIVEVRNREASCQVYNLSTQEGWYSASNFITANCRCTVLFITSDGADAGSSDSEE